MDNPLGLIELLAVVVVCGVLLFTALNRIANSPDRLARSDGRRWLPVTLLGGVVTLTAAMPVVSVLSAGEPRDLHVTIRARQYAYDPPVIRVRQGDLLHLRLKSQDVLHGFYLEGYDVNAEIRPASRLIRVSHPSKGDGWSEEDEIVFVAAKAGKFHYRCSHTCGFLHPFMSGELIVEPNHLYHAGLSASAALFLGFIILIAGNKRNGTSSSETPNRDSGDISA